MQKKFTYHSAEIYYRVTGKGKPVLLLHGFGEDSHIWDEQVAILQEHCLLIVPDLPGSGKSSLLSLELGVRSLEYWEKQNTTPDFRLQTPDSISIDDYADCIHALLQHEGINSCILIGHSMGGYITLAFAEKYPSLLTSFGLIHSTSFADSEEKKRIREKGIAFMEEHGAQAFLKTSIPNLFAERVKKNNPEKVDALIAQAAHFTKETLQQYYRAMIMRPDRRAVLESNPLPVLFVMGTEDMAVPLDEVLQQTHLPVKSYIHILPDTGHMSMWEMPDQLSQFIVDFIKD